MSGQFNPVAGQPDIIWRTVVEHGKWLVAVEAVHGSTTGDGWLNIWDGTTHAIIHRTRTKIKNSALFGVDQQGVREWEEETVKAITNPDYRRIEVLG